MIKFRNLTADEIECRVQQCTKDGVSLLLYKNARCDMNILDETVGTENWQREHYECKGNLFCKVGINAEYNDSSASPEWIWKSDCGTESNTEAEKGEASDSFKRACVNWGIGRELYTSPTIWIKAENCNVKDTGRKDKYGKPIYTCKDKFIIEKIAISEDKKITGVAIINTKLGKRAFVWSAS